jgi:Leucine-rich repeat (LRR) protein
LKWLILSGNQFNKVPEELQNAINVEYLNLNDNPITDLNSESFQGLVTLKGLNISSMPNLALIDANTFTPLTSMIHLWCSNNPKLKKINSKAFNNMIESDGTLKLSEVCASFFNFF